jgi:hypothetical protein
MQTGQIIKNAFETLERTVGQVAGDAVEQITGDFKELPPEEKKQIENEERAKLQRIRANLLKPAPSPAPPTPEKKQEVQQKQIKEMQKKQKKDNALQRLINMTKGSQERKSGDNVQ